MAVHQVEAFEIDKRGAIIWRARGLHHTDNGEPKIVSMSGGITVRGIKLVAHTDFHCFGNT